MDLKRIRRRFSWPAFVLAITSLLLVLYIESKAVFDSGNLAGVLVLVSLATAILALVLALLSLPSRLGMLAIAVVIVVTYLIFFTRLYGLS